jgi:hypothetical protein
VKNLDGNGPAAIHSLREEDRGHGALAELPVNPVTPSEGQAERGGDFSHRVRVIGLDKLPPRRAGQ